MASIPQNTLDMAKRWSGKKENRLDDGTVIQTLILSKDRFRNRGSADKWILGHEFKARFMGKAPDETDTSWRYRQRQPHRMEASTLKTWHLAEGVQAVSGLLRTR